MRRWLQIILAILLAIVLANDAARYVTTLFSMDNLVAIAAEHAATAARQAGDDPMPGFLAAQAIAAQEEAEVFGYQQESGQVHIWVRGPVKGTIVLGPLVAGIVEGSFDATMTIEKDTIRRYGQ